MVVQKSIQSSNLIKQKPTGGLTTTIVSSIHQLYPSAPLNAPDGRGTAKETIKYTGDLIVGIATMHKSNAVPVMKGTKQAEEIAKMRRG